MHGLELVLVEHPVFQGIDKRYLQMIIGCASDVRFEAGKYIFQEGEEANQFYIIRQGKVVLEVVFVLQMEPTIIHTIGDGGVLGWSWLFPPYRWRFDARAIEHTEAIVFDGRYLRTKCEENQQLGYELVKRFSHIMEQRLQALRNLQLLERHKKDYDL